MASGFNDWINFLGITGQGSGWLTARPTYGASQIQQLITNCAGNSITSITSISGTGKIYGGFIFLFADNDHKDDRPMISIDGVTMGIKSFRSLFEYGHERLYNNIFHILKYDTVNFMYNVGILPDITFDSSFQLKYNNFEADAENVSTHVVYSLIT